MFIVKVTCYNFCSSGRINGRYLWEDHLLCAFSLARYKWRREAKIISIGGSRCQQSDDSVSQKLIRLKLFIQSRLHVIYFCRCQSARKFLVFFWGVDSSKMLPSIRSSRPCVCPTAQLPRWVIYCRSDNLSLDRREHYMYVLTTIQSLAHAFNLSEK
jgi:hypothetical protein